MVGEVDRPAGRVVGVGDDDGAASRRDRRQQLVERKSQVRLGVGHQDRLGPGDLRVELEHREGRPGHHDLVAGLDVGLHQDVDAFVGAVGEG